MMKFNSSFWSSIIILTSITTNNNCIAQTRQQQEFIQGVGYIEPVSQVLRLNFKHPGIINDIQVHVGQQVKKGTLLAKQNNNEEQALLLVEQNLLELAKVETQQLQAGVNPAKIKAQQTAIAAKKAMAEYLKRHGQRLDNLSADDAIPIASRDQAISEALRSEAELKTAQAELRYLEEFVRPVDLAVALNKQSIAQSKIKLQQARLADTELVAPIDGTVLQILRQTGDSSDLSEPVLLFANLKQLQVRAEFDEDYALLLKLGQSVEIHFKGNQQKAIQGNVKQISPLMGKKTVFSRTATERKDIDVRQVLVQLPEDIDLPVGLETDVIIDLKHH